MDIFYLPSLRLTQNAMPSFFICYTYDSFIYFLIVPFLFYLVPTLSLPGVQGFLVIMASSGSNEKRGDDRKGGEEVWKMEAKDKDGTPRNSVVSAEESEAQVSQPRSTTVTGVSAIPTSWRVKSSNYRLTPKSSARLYRNPYYNLIHNFGVENTSRLDIPGPWDRHIPKRGNNEENNSWGTTNNQIM